MVISIQWSRWRYMNNFSNLYCGKDALKWQCHFHRRRIPAPGLFHYLFGYYHCRPTVPVRDQLHNLYTNYHQRSIVPSLGRLCLRLQIHSMAGSKFSYVRSFECEDRLAPEQWVVLSLTQRCSSPTHPFLASNFARDAHASLLLTASRETMQYFKDLTLVYVHFESLDFVFRKETSLYKRRRFKLITYLVSSVTSAYVRHWQQHFPFTDMLELPVFDAKVHLLPNDQLLRDLLTQQQMKHHIINLKNTLQIAINNKMKHVDYHSQCSKNGQNCPLEHSHVIGSADQPHSLGQPSTNDVQTNKPESFYNEILFSHFGINYNNEEASLKKGSILLRQSVSESIETTSRRVCIRPISKIIQIVADFQNDSFWKTGNGLYLSVDTRANSKFHMLSSFIVDSKLLPHSWLVLRVDGKAFHKLSHDHEFTKPNDRAAIDLMNHAAAQLMLAMPDITIAYGESDEFSFVFDRYRKHPVTSSMLQSNSLLSRCVSIFTASFVANWDATFCVKHAHSDQVCFFFENTVKMGPNSTVNWLRKTRSLSNTDQSTSRKHLKYSPMFDGRLVLYPTTTSLRDYLSWRQADCHINNMYNTAFWTLIHRQHCTNRQADQRLNGTFAADKRDIMRTLGVDYDKEPAIHRKGSVLYRQKPEQMLKHKECNVLPQASLLSSTSITVTQSLSNACTTLDEADRCDGNTSFSSSTDTNPFSGSCEQQHNVVDTALSTGDCSDQEVVVADTLVLCHRDIIGDEFWLQNPHLLGAEQSALTFQE